MTMRELANDVAVEVVTILTEKGYDLGMDGTMILFDVCSSVLEVPMDYDKYSRA